MISTADQYAQMVDAVVDCGFYRLDKSGVIRTWNAGAERMKGYTSDQIIGRNFCLFFTKDDRDAGVPEQLLRTAVLDGRCISAGWRVRKSGETFWAQVVIDPIVDQHGDVAGFVKITRDITADRLMQIKLEESRIRYKYLVNHVADCALFTLAIDGTINEWSDSAARVNGYTEAQIRGLHISQFHTEEDRKANLPQTLLEIATETGHYETEGWRIRGDGSRFWARVAVDAMRNSDGKLIGFAKFVRDLTEQKAAEARLLQVQEALLHTQKVESIGRLSAGVAHDFNNILQSIIGALELALAGGTDPASFCGIALRSAIRGSTLTNQLLCYARKQVLQPSELKLRPFFKELHELLSRTLNPQLSIKVRIAGNPSVFVDRGQFQAALLNLAINASHAMPNGGDLMIDVRTERAGKGHVVCTIEDNGIGMDQETLRLSVEPFFTTKGVKGSGLGLSMVQGFVEQSGGEFSIKSRVGEGTSIQLRLPPTASRVKLGGSERENTTPRAASEVRKPAADHVGISLLGASVTENA